MQLESADFSVDLFGERSWIYSTKLRLPGGLSRGLPLLVEVPGFHDLISQRFVG